MNTGLTVADQASRIADLMESRLGIGGRGLEAKLKRARRSMPKWVRQEAQRLVEAERLMAHPKLMMQADPEALKHSYKRCERYLKSVDPNAWIKDYWLQFAAVNAFNLLLVVGLLLAVLWAVG
ncbi:hypothetical protein [Candidatus Rhodobacter oscarellae]|uniref:hypothetical protein n=1 Tax=Candidatus Rhodobacter oscarellae TaxID=1675527 RepID=UPI000670FE61|nr:hypothetical protein [Candidatus Rhodobacter lobularis]